MTKRILVCIFAALFLLCPVFSAFSADNTTGEQPVTAVSGGSGGDAPVSEGMNQNLSEEEAKIIWRHQKKSIFPYSKLYGGIGGTYAFEIFDHEDTSVLGWEPSYDNTFGGYTRFGYCFGQWIDGVLFSLELHAEYLPGFEWEESNLSSEIDIATVMGCFKASLSWRFSPYLIGGIGAMYADVTFSEYRRGADGGKHLYKDYDTDEIDLCARIGIGFDYFISRNISCGLETMVTQGTGDVKNMRYITASTGINFYF